jgi:hypothetical protein
MSFFSENDQLFESVRVSGNSSMRAALGSFSWHSNVMNKIPLIMPREVFSEQDQDFSRMRDNGDP